MEIGERLGWFFCCDESHTIPDADATNFIAVEFPHNSLNSSLKEVWFPCAFICNRKGGLREGEGSRGCGDYGGGRGGTVRGTRGMHAGRATCDFHIEIIMHGRDGCSLFFLWNEAMEEVGVKGYVRGVPLIITAHTTHTHTHSASPPSPKSGIQGGVWHPEKCEKKIIV